MIPDITVPLKTKETENDKDKLIYPVKGSLQHELLLQQQLIQKRQQQQQQLQGAELLAPDLQQTKSSIPTTQQQQQQELHNNNSNNNNNQRKKLIVFSTSITKGIDPKRFNECYEYGYSRFQRYHGGRVRHIKQYVDSHLEEEKPNVTIIQAGGNDLQSGELSISQIANDIMEIAHKSRNANVADIFIGGVPSRSNAYAKKRGDDLNQAVKDLCETHGFTFIDNTDITTSHLYDGIHLTKDGSKILADNYLGAMDRKFLNVNVESK